MILELMATILQKHYPLPAIIHLLSRTKVISTQYSVTIKMPTRISFRTILEIIRESLCWGSKRTVLRFSLRLEIILKLNSYPQPYKWIITTSDGYKYFFG